MKFDEFLKRVEKLPVIEAEALSVGSASPVKLRVQLSRWSRSGKLIQLRRGVYLLSKRYRKIEIFEPYIASILKKPSYVSLEKALEFHGVIPEAVPVYTSVTTKRAISFSSEAGRFSYQHIRKSLFWGYGSVTMNKQTAFIAAAEKALLDLIYLKAKNVSPEYVDELRLQNIGKIGMKRLREFAARFNKPKMLRAAAMICEYIKSHKEREKRL